MFLTFFTLFYVLFGSSCGLRSKDVCYRDSAEIEPFPYPFYQGPVYLYPRAGGARKLLMNKRLAMDDRLKVYPTKVILTQLTEADNGNIVIVGIDGQNINLFSLTIIECSTKMLYYGKDFVYDVPSNAELIEFTPSLHLDQQKLLWDRANPRKDYGTRGKVSKRLFKISKVTQEDNGYYNFKQKDKWVMLRLQLLVQEDTSYHTGDVNLDISLQFPWANGNWTVTYRPQSGGEEVTVIQAGHAVWKNNPFYNRMKIEDSGVDILSLEHSDAGIFTFRDPAGNLALVSQLDIKESQSSLTYAIVIAVVALGVPFCCCCCFCCCKKCCCKNEKPQTAQLMTYTHDSNEPPGPGSSPPPYSAASPPAAVNAGISHDAAAASSEPVSYQPTFEIVNTPQPEVIPLVSEMSPPSSSFGYNLLSADYEPVFEVKGLSSTFDLPLSAETSSSDVYTSDKINFL